MAVSVVSGALSSFGDSCVSSSISAVTQSSSSTGSNIENGALTASASDWSGANSMAISSASSMSLKVPIPFIVTLPLSASPSAIKVANSFKKADARLSLQPLILTNDVIISGNGMVFIVLPPLFCVLKDFLLRISLQLKEGAASVVLK